MLGHLDPGMDRCDEKGLVILSYGGPSSAHGQPPPLPHGGVRNAQDIRQGGWYSLRTLDPSQPKARGESANDPKATWVISAA